jgi:hypothetical protein
MTPLVTALSSARIASVTAARVSAALSPRAVRAFFTAVRTLERTARLRRRRRSLCRIRLRADDVLANESSSTI